MTVHFPVIDVRQNIDGTWNQIFISETITVPSVAPYIVQLREIPDEGLINDDPFISGLVITSVYPPSSGQFYVNYCTGTLAFNPAQAGLTFNVDYHAKGSVVEASEINWLWEQTKRYTISNVPPTEYNYGYQWFNSLNNQLYVYDSRDKWLSNNSKDVIFAKLGNAQNQLLSVFGNNNPVIFNGYRLKRKMTLVSVQAELQTSSTCTFHIRKNNSNTSLFSINITGSSYYFSETVDLDFDSVDMVQVYIESSGYIVSPKIELEFKERYV